MEVKTKESNVVTDIGNSWVVCRSKSHKGYIYYFNTLTGQAVWNLSEAEVEKAKPKVLGSDAKPLNIEYCPEPKGQPKDYINKFPTLIQSTFGNICTAINPITQSSKPLLSNSNILPIPTNSQIFIAPTHPLVNQGITAVNIAYNNMEPTISVQNNELPLSKRFEYVGATADNRKSPKGRLFHKESFSSQRRENYGYSQRKSPYITKQNSHIDLREKISAKRNLFKRDYVQTYAKEDNNEDYQPHSIKTSGYTKLNLSNSDIEDDWDGNIRNDVLESGLEYLRNLRTPNRNSSHWYLVTETNILLTHLRFLSVLANADSQCQVLVAPQVRKELQGFVDDSNPLTVHARRALRFLSHQTRSEKHVICEEEANTSTYAYCMKLANENYHVVLVCNEKDLIKYKHMPNIHTFSVNQLKTIVTDKSFQIPVKLGDVPDCGIKITLNNDLNKNIHESESCNFQEKIQALSKHKNKNENKSFDFLNKLKTPSNPLIMQPDNLYEKNELKKPLQTPSKNITAAPINLEQLNKPDATRTSKSTVDVEIQTDFSSTEIVDLSEKCEKLVKISRTESGKVENLEHLDCKQVKKREIKLKRISNHRVIPDQIQMIENKHFKWRKRRRENRVVPSSSTTLSTVSSSDNFNKIEQAQYATSTPNINEKIESPPIKLIEEEPFKQLNSDISFDDYAESSERSSCKQRKSGENLIVEGTSSSDIISNTTSSYADSEILCDVTAKNIKLNNKQSVQGDQSKHVMFEVSSEVMEECLRMRCDEWISRYVQIMEEVLTQVLEQGEPFVHSAFPAPWTLQEATQCIKCKFKNSNDVKDAADKLSFILFKISDRQGTIAKMISPSEYMKLYSYGVYLVDTLQSIWEENEDLQVAAESLSKLLTDIENPNMDCVQNDSFVDTIQETSGITEQFIDKEQNCDHDKMSVDQGNGKEKIESILKRGNTSNLQSRKPSIRDQLEANSNVTQNIKSKFFSSLNLQRTIDVGGKSSEDNVCDKDRNTSSVNTNVESPKLNIKEQNADTVTKTDNVTSSEPKIIRNFVKCLEFEKRINSQQASGINPLNCFHENEDLDEDYYEDYTDEENSCDNVLKNENSRELDDYKYMPDGNETNNVEFVNRSQSYTENTKSCEDFIKLVLLEVKEAFRQVQLLCEKINEKSSRLCRSKQNKLFEESEHTLSRLQMLHKALRSVVERESKSINDQQLEDLRDSVTYMKYRDIIKKCMDQAKNYVDIVSNIMIAVKE